MRQAKTLAEELRVKPYCRCHSKWILSDIACPDFSSIDPLHKWDECYWAIACFNCKHKTNFLSVLNEYKKMREHQELMEKDRNRPYKEEK